MEKNCLDISGKIEAKYGGLFLGNSELLGKKHSKIWAHWGKVRFWYISMSASVENGCKAVW